MQFVSEYLVSEKIKTCILRKYLKTRAAKKKHHSSSLPMLAVNAISGRSMVISVFNCEKWWLNIFLIAFQLILVMLMNNWYYTNTMVMVMVMVPAKLRMSSAISSGSSIAPKCPPLKMRKISFKGSHKKIRYYLQKKSPNVVNPPTQPIDLRLGTWICRKIPAKKWTFNLIWCSNGQIWHFLIEFS